MEWKTHRSFIRVDSLVDFFHGFWLAAASQAHFFSHFVVERSNSKRQMNSGWWFQILCMFTAKIGEMIQFDEYICFKWVARNHQLGSDPFVLKQCQEFLVR